MNFVAEIEKYFADRETGQLVIKYAEVKYLCKASLVDGEIVYIKLGTMSPGETLAYVADKTIEDVSFISGMPARKKLASPVTAAFRQALSGVIPVIENPRPVPVAAPEPEKPVAKSLPREDPGGPIPPAFIDKVVDGFIDLVGPLGTVLASNAAAHVGYVRGATMSSGGFERFFAELLVEIPEEERVAFSTRYQPPEE